MVSFFLRFIIPALILNLNIAAFAQDEEDLRKTYAQDLKNIENYLNNVKNIRADFVQVSDNNQIATGKFYLSRPGKIRWEYKEPDKILIIGKNDMIAYFDIELNQISYVSIDESLIGLLAKENISFDSNFKIVDINKTKNQINIKLKQENIENNNSISLIFDHKVSLIGMNIVDSVGNNINILFDQLEYVEKLDQSLFDFPRKAQKRVRGR